MLIEAREAPAAVANQLAHDSRAWRDFGALLRSQPPGSLLTVVSRCSVKSSMA